MQFKKNISILLLAIGLAFLCYFGIKIVQNLSKNTTRNLIIPNFTKKDNKGQVISKQNLRANCLSVFIAFHPDCEHCQYEAKSINDKQKELENTNIVLFTSANDSLIQAFSKTYGLDTLNNIHILSDKKNEMYQQFGVKIIPSVFIYDADGKLLKHYKGETKIEAILKTLNL